MMEEMEERWAELEQKEMEQDSIAVKELEKELQRKEEEAAQLKRE